VGVMPAENGMALIFPTDGAVILKGGGTEEVLGLNDDKRFWADDLRRMLGLWVAISVAKCAIVNVSNR
jgi:hypothetical protein